MPPQLIPLQLMRQQVDAGPGNDWTGTTDSKERKKMQDRIHQRIRRWYILNSFYMAVLISDRRRLGQRMKIRMDGSVKSARHTPPHLTVMEKPPSGSFDGIQLSCSYYSSYMGDPARKTAPFTLPSFTACEPDSERTETFLSQFSIEMIANFNLVAPSMDMLPSLVQFNTTRALVMNARVMGVTSEVMVPGSRSQLADGTISSAAYDLIPESLKPTQLQLTIRHHPWIDILPFPEVRDNILRHDEGLYDKTELCRDMRGFQSVAHGRGGLIVWGDPWDPAGWEVTNAFAAKWPWVIKGCHDLLRYTRYWKELRGEM